MLLYILKRWSRFGNYLALFETGLNQAATRHFRHFLVAFILYVGTKNITGLNRSTFNRCHLSSFDRFITEGSWEARDFERIRLDYLNRKLRRFLDTRQAKGQLVPAFLCIDDTNNPKVGHKADWVSRQYSHLAGGNILCWCMVTGIMVVGDYTIPFSFRLYRRKEDCIAKGQPQLYRSKLELAIQLIEEWQPPQGTKPLVLVANWYLSQSLLEVCERRGFSLIAGIKSNRTISLLDEDKQRADTNQNQSQSQKKLSLKELGTNLAASAYQPVTLGKQRWLMASRTVALKGGYRVKLVISKGKGWQSASLNYWVCTDPSLGVQTLMEWYGVRWEIETFHKQAKQLLGLNDNQCQRERSILRLWTLLLIAYSYLVIERVEYADEYKSGRERLPTLGEVKPEHQRLGHQALAEWVYCEAKAGTDLSLLLDQIRA